MKIVIFDLDETLYDTYGTQLVYDDVIEVLEHLQTGGCELCVLTAGDESLQKQKVDRCGLADLFPKLRFEFVPDPSDKEGFFRDISDKMIFGRSPQDLESNDIFVVGDRIDREIVYGNFLGFTTVRVRRPGCKYGKQTPLSDSQVATHQITTLKELPQIVFG